jgi:RNA polymerase sigma factor (sigma-70 family)
MTARHINRVVGRLRRAVGTDAACSDAQLLERFISRREPAAFETLLSRHGPMVLGVCRRVLGNEADAEDAFQATFLVLVRRAASVVPRERVGNWLYGVACRTAMKARSMNGKRRLRERQAGERTMVPANVEDSWPELRAVLDEELARLPDRYRDPVILCDLEAKTHREAARLLGWPDGTLTTRLIAARRLLAARLTRRGVVWSAGAVAALVAPTAVPATLAAPTTRAALAPLAGMVPAKVAALTEGVLKAMLIAKLKTVAAGVLGLVLLGAGAGALTFEGQAQEPGATGNDRLPAEGKAIQQPETGDRAAGQRHGVVTAIDGKGLLQISLGSDDKVERGQQLDVYRLQPKPAYLGRVQVVEALASSCVARPVIPIQGKKIGVGDRVTDELLPTPAGKAAVEGPGWAPSQVPPATNLEGKVTRVDANHHVVDISIGADDGVREGQTLHVYRTGPRDTTYLGRVKVLVTYGRSAATRTVDVALEARIIVGDRVCLDEQPIRSGATDLPGEGTQPPSAAAPPLDARHTVELFLSAAQAGKMDAARALIVPAMPKHLLEEVPALSKQAPSIAHVQADAAEALVISEAFAFKGGNQSGKMRYVVHLRRWDTAGNAGSPTAGTANRWLVADLTACDSEAALTKLIDFLRSHPGAHPLLSGARP